MANGFARPGALCGVGSFVHAHRRWLWVPFVAAVAVAPVVLAPFCELPFIAFAATPMAIYLGVWVFFRQLDAPPDRRPPPPPRGDRPAEPPRRPRAPGAPRAGQARARAARRRAPVA